MQTSFKNCRVGDQFAQRQLRRCAEASYYIVRSYDRCLMVPRMVQSDGFVSQRLRNLGRQLPTLWEQLVISIKDSLPKGGSGVRSS